MTSLYGGGNYAKDYIRIEAYGSVDELNATLGHLSDLLGLEPYTSTILQIQNLLFEIGANLATTSGKKPPFGDFNQRFTAFLEEQIDLMEQELSPLKHFILPGGHPVVSYCHIARTVCRRAERRIVSLQAQESIDTGVIVYLNRLSDYLFVLGRTIARHYGVQEVIWQGLEKE